MKNTKSKMKNNLGIIDSRLDEAEEWISHLEDKVAENAQSQQQQEKIIQKSEDSLRGLWYNIKHTTICITRYKIEKRVGKELKTYFNSLK